MDSTPCRTLKLLKSYQFDIVLSILCCEILKKKFIRNKSNATVNSQKSELMWWMVDPDPEKSGFPCIGHKLAASIKSSDKLHILSLLPRINTQEHFST